MSAGDGHLLQAAMIRIRKGQSPGELARAEFNIRFRASITDTGVPGGRSRYCAARRGPLAGLYPRPQGPVYTEGGPAYADPDSELSAEWIATKHRIDEAQLHWADPGSPFSGAGDLRLGA